MKNDKICLLYVTTNDGSDMRINKEVKTLSKKFSVIFVGVGDYSKCYIEDYCSKTILIDGKRNSVKVLLRQVIVILKALSKVKRIHIINEQFLFLLYPILFFKYTVIDLFDSIFLKKNYSGNKLKFIKYMLFMPVNRIIVTDENRYELMPNILQHKCIILPNYPEKIDFCKNKEESDSLRILYNGWMGKNRGTEIIEGLLQLNLPIHIYMLGWFSDDYTKQMVRRYSEQITYMGTIPQKDALLFTNQYADYILCTYAPINENNINASPNKVYDAILTNTPLIINSEIKISEWVRVKDLGCIIPKYNVVDFSHLYKELCDKKKHFLFDKIIKSQYTWNSVESELLKAHNI
ncbi:hypothetical protein [Dysgonomonas mossii]|uniref:hypothetical protein n=1 Tax=Dysgonomonas mossii TaxID=163665 RepID=UPI003995650C